MFATLREQHKIVPMSKEHEMLKNIQNNIIEIKYDNNLDEGIGIKLFRYVSSCAVFKASDTLHCKNACWEYNFMCN